MADISANKKTIHSAIVIKHLHKRNNNKILQALPPNIYSSEETPPPPPPAHDDTLAQLRTNKSPFHKSYLCKLNAHKHPSPPLQLKTHTHNVVTHGFLDKPHGGGRIAGTME